MAFDEHFASVVLLLHGNGSNGSTTFTDSSSSPKTVTAYGNAQISTAQSKWGGSSIALDGTGDYFSIADEGAFAFAGDYTVEFQAMANLAEDTATLCSADSSVYLYGNYFDGGPFALTGLALDSNPATWKHIAITRFGTTVRFFQDGVLKGSTGTVSGEVHYYTGLNFGRYVAANAYFKTAYLDEIRLTAGIARYTADFTPPSEAFGDSLPVAPLAYIAVPTPLGGPAVKVFYGVNLAAHLSAPSPLAGAAALLYTLVGRVSAPSPLRGAAALLYTLVGLATAPSPLGRPAVLAQHDFTAALGDVSTHWVMDLVTPTGLVRVPISSWQATLQSGSSCYVQCVVPACMAWVDAINAATEFVIYRRAEVPGTALAIEYEMARSAAEQAQFDQGPQRYTCTLSGYPDAFAASLDPPVVYDRTLNGVRSVSSGSSLRVRCAVDWLLRPGHRAYVGGVPFVVRFINYYALAGDGYMDVGE